MTALKATTLTIRIDDHYGSTHTIEYDLNPSNPGDTMRLFTRVVAAVDGLARSPAPQPAKDQA